GGGAGGRGAGSGRGGYGASQPPHGPTGAAGNPRSFVKPAVPASSNVPAKSPPTQRTSTDGSPSRTVPAQPRSQPPASRPGHQVSAAASSTASAAGTATEPVASSSAASTGTA